MTDPVARVCEVAGDIPPGRVMTYGDIGHIVGLGPRQVGTILASGSVKCWWRVTNAQGRLPEHLQAEACERYTEEETPMRGGHAAIKLARWSPFDEEHDGAFSDQTS